MDIQKKIPSDMEDLRYEYESKIPKEGTCGPTLIAFLTGMSVREVILNWSIPYRGYCSFSELEREINKYNFQTEKIQANEDYILPEGIEMAIARIQWKKKYANFPIPEKNTHFVYLEKTYGQVHLFDNTEGWFEPEWPIAKEYLKRGSITSLLKLL